MKINPRECKSYGKGGYCCTRAMCGLGKDRCNEIAHCGHGRLRCHVKIGSDTQCISFKPKSKHITKKKRKKKIYKHKNRL